MTFNLELISWIEADVRTWIFRLTAVPSVVVWPLGLEMATVF